MVENTKNTALETIRDAKYIALETFRKNGEGVITPVWQTPEDNKLYVWTEADTWKIKRIRNNPQVRVCASDYKGTPKSDWVDAQADILDTSETETAQHKRMAAKYGLQFRIFNLLSKLRRSNFAVLEISFDK
jgi:PPOX class probable F420-dependent enzyme